MGYNSCSSSESAILSKNSKVVALESTLQQCVLIFRELIVDLEQLQIESDQYKSLYIELKEKCESKKCTEVENLQKEIIKKNQVIQSVASILTKLNGTKDNTILSEAFKVLNQDTSPLTPPDDKTTIKQTTPTKDIHNLIPLTKDKAIENSKKQSPKSSKTPKKVITPTKTEPLNNGTKTFQSSKLESPKKSSGTPKKIGLKNQSPKRDTSITEDISFNEESLCEIDGTPTGRTSPIIPSKRTRSTIAKSTDCNKKKLPDGWSSSPCKAVKLTFTTPTGGRGRLVQSRINLVKVKPTTVVDLTCSPEVNMDTKFVQALVKKESIENDDTILPSPTSNNSLFKPISKNSPVKFKKPPLSLVKTEKLEKQDENQDIKQMEESISLMNRIPERIKVKTETPTYTEPMEMDENATHCETQTSVSLLNHVDRLENQHQNLLQKSPSKIPLAENINVMNTPPKADGDSSISLLRPTDNPLNINNVKRRVPELVEPLYREPAPRKKAEKRALPGWSCDECRNFYGALYKDDPEMLARKVSQCSRHRGRRDPARPRTPDGFWEPRWTVPTDTEELNRINNAV